MARAWVDAFNPSTGTGRGVETGTDGTYSLSLKSGTWFINVVKQGYTTSAEPTKVTVSGTVNLTLSTAGSTITGTISNANGTVNKAWVWAKENTTGAWAGGETSPAGTYSLSVANSTTWQICASDGQYENCILNAAAGSTGKNITLTTQSTNYDSTKKPIANPITPSLGGVVSDRNLGVSVNIPPNALGNAIDSTQFQIATAAAPKSAKRESLGTPLQITATDSSGTAVTDVSTGELDIDMSLDKSEIDDLLDTEEIKLNSRYNDLEVINVAYWNSNEWVEEATTRSIEVKANSNSEFTSVDYTTAMAALETNPDVYFDYTVTLSTSVDHLTL
ncbi:MAG: hypothetical protein ACD_28C00094G0001, partial [uncultured bacterium]